MSYLHVSSQAEIGTNQLSETFFNKITEHFNSKSDTHQRDWSQVQTWQVQLFFFSVVEWILIVNSHSWNTLRASTLKFSGCYSRIYRVPRSGCNLVDIVRDAKALYTAEDKQKREFKSELAWEVLRHKPKWNPVPPTTSIASSVATDTDCTSTRASSPVRPVGKKTSKHSRLSKAKRAREEDDETLAEAKAQAQATQERRVSAMEESN